MLLIDCHFQQVNYSRLSLENRSFDPKKMMDPGQSDAGLLTGVVELDEMFVGGSLRPQVGIKHKRGKVTQKNEF